MATKKPDLSEVFAKNEGQYRPQEIQEDTPEERTVDVESTQVKRPPSRQKITCWHICGRGSSHS